MNASLRALLLVVLALAALCVFWPHSTFGVVADQNGPIEGAVVRCQGERDSVRTDHQGRFPLPLSTGKSKRITAWKPGYAIGSIPIGTDPLRMQLVPLPTEDNDDYQWLDPTPNASQPHNCGNCHAEIRREWSLSSHAKSAANPRVLEAFAAVAKERPNETGVCAKCHAPTMRDLTLDYDLRKVKGVDAHGVHCDYCHKVVDATADKVGTRFGADGVHLLRPANGQMLFFGPLDDAVREGEQFSYAPVYKDSRYCASCHEGIIYGVHVYSTYSEWLESPARKQGKECQNCHMAPTGKLTNIAPGKGGVERDPLTLASHVMPGATEEMLKRCLSVRVSVKGTEVDVEVKADNVGHRVPTGFPDRHLVLFVDAFDAKGRRLDIEQSARPTKVIGASGWSKIYAKRVKDPATAKPMPFWRWQEEPQDTRLLPGKADRVHYGFAEPVYRVSVRLVYRWKWQDELRTQRPAPNAEIVVFDQAFSSKE